MLASMSEVQPIITNYRDDLVAKSHGKASECLECGQCEAQCPQHIDIIDNLKLVAQSFEESTNN